MRPIHRWRGRGAAPSLAIALLLAALVALLIAPTWRSGAADQVPVAGTAPEQAAPTGSQGPVEFFVTAVPSPSLFVTRGQIVNLDLRVSMQRGREVEDALVRIIFDPAAVELLDNQSSQEQVWVSEVGANYLNVRLGRVKENDQFSFRVRFRVREAASNGAFVAGRAQLQWRDPNSKGATLSNRPFVRVNDYNADGTIYPIEVVGGGLLYRFNSDLFAPGEHVGVWYNPPGGQATTVGTFIVGEDGSFTVDLPTDGIAPGNYALVMNGQRSKTFGSAPFTIP